MTRSLPLPLLAAVVVATVAPSGCDRPPPPDPPKTSAPVAGTTPSAGGAPAQAGPASPASCEAVGRGDLVERPPEEGCGKAPHIRFTDVTASSGLDRFRYAMGDFHMDNILESSGGGVAFLDADGDGDLDVYFANGAYLEGISDPKGKSYFAAADNAYFRNNGDGTFTEATAAAGLSDRRWSLGVNVADFDDDGDADLFVSNFGPNALFRNHGDGTFTDVARALGVQGPDRLNGWTKMSVGGLFLDFDRDGDLDLMVCNFLAFDPSHLHPGAPWEMPDPTEYPGQLSILYRQEADGTFRDVTAAAGMDRPRARCMGLTAFDFDADGFLDVFQANDHHENYLWRNRGDGTFEEVARRAGVAFNADGVGTGSMAGTLGDVDGDGRIDLLVTDLSFGALYRNLGNGTFADATVTSRVKAALDGLGSWGAGLQDFDLDGDLDLFATNGLGHLPEGRRDSILANDGTGRFTDVGPDASPYFLEKRSGRGAAFGDYDNDGDVDILISQMDHRATPTLLRNDGVGAGPGRHFLSIRLVGTRSPRDAPGAEVSVRLPDGRVLVRVNQWSTSYLSSNDPRVHFGLGAAERVEEVVVRWPSGRVQRLGTTPADQFLTVTEPGQDQASTDRAGKEPRR